MSETHDADRQMDELIEQYLVFLRGQGPEPDLGRLSPARRRAVRARLQIVDTLFGLDADLPPLANDPVAIQLGLVPDPESGDYPEGSTGGGEGVSDESERAGEPTAGTTGSRRDARVDLSAHDWPGMDAARRVLDELEADFAGQVSIDWQPTWAHWSMTVSDIQEPLLAPLAQCSVLGDAVALFITTVTPALWFDTVAETPGQVAPDPNKGANGDAAGDIGKWSHQPREWHSTEPDGPAGVHGVREAEQLALFLRHHPDVSSVGLVSPDGTQAAILPAAACHRSIDPVRGWLEPGAFVVSDDLQLTLARYFEQRLPRWERVAGLSDVLAVSDDSTATHALVETQRDMLLQARPRLEHKKYAQQALHDVDVYAVTTLISAVQAGQIDAHDFVGRVEALAGDTS